MRREGAAPAAAAGDRFNQAPSERAGERRCNWV